MTISLEIDDRERDACDEMRARLGLSNDDELLRAALYKLAAWLEPDIDTTLFRQRRNQRPPVVEEAGEPSTTGARDRG